MPLGDVEREIRAAGYDPRVRVLRQLARQLGLRARRRKAPLLCHAIERARIIDGVQRSDNRRRHRRKAINSTRRERIARRVHNRAIAGAAAEIASQRIVNGLRLRRLALPESCKQRHDKARRAEAALAGVPLHHGRLHGMQKRAVRQTLYCDKQLAVNLAHHQNTGVRRPPVESAFMRVRQHDGASPAIALGAALFRASESAVRAQPLQHAEIRRRFRRNLGESVQKKPNRIAHEQRIPGFQRKGTYFENKRCSLDCARPRARFLAAPRRCARGRARSKTPRKSPLSRGTTTGQPANRRAQARQAMRTTVPRQNL